MLLQAITATNSPLSPKSPNECGLNVFSLFFYAGMHGLCSAWHLYIPLFLYILSVTANVALSLFVPSQNNSRRQTPIHRVNSYSNDSVSGASSATGNYLQNRQDSTITVRSPRGINKRSVDYFVSLPQMSRPLLLTNLRGFTLRVRSNGKVSGYSNIPNNIPDMLLYILKVSPESSGDRKIDSKAVEIVIQALHSNRYVCMDPKGDVYTQKMVNNSITFDCIWQLRSHCLGTSISSSYYPQPVHYIKNTRNIKRWFLAIDRYGNIRNGNKTKGRRVSSIWRVSPSAAAMNLANDRGVMNAMVRDGIGLKDPRNPSPRKRTPAGLIDPNTLLDANRVREINECSRIENELKKHVKEDLKKSRAILIDANMTREEIVKLMKLDSTHYSARDLKRFRKVYDKWILNHWLSFKFRKQGHCIRKKLKKLKRKHKKQPRRHLRHRMRNLQKSLRMINEDLSDWRLSKKRMIDFIRPLTFVLYSRRKNRTRIHDIIRNELHLTNLHTFKQIRWAVYVDRHFHSNHAFILKYDESRRRIGLSKSRRHFANGSCWKLPQIPIKKIPTFPLHKWHRHLSCVQEYDRRLKQLVLQVVNRRG